MPSTAQFLKMIEVGDMLYSLKVHAIRVSERDDMAWYEAILRAPQNPGTDFWGRMKEVALMLDEDIDAESSSFNPIPYIRHAATDALEEQLSGGDRDRPHLIRLLDVLTWFEDVLCWEECGDPY
ncbi:hypothetical protein SAMN05421853_12314 [Roseivivax halotolerans]|uniref:Uncharacterized protein n=1 Tax=Roseivivax halotolerans TaxID=93684 RepID=A0A1I6AKE5_9RHOB|nr:hypothetical protein [Roseivivax halotolerans]SFQ69191.1 hypothetical protein SAMN05421853_12314 [Roseivivax halotolerans]